MMKKYHKTAQRAAIMDFLKNNKHHPSALDIYNAVSKKLSTISVTTIYNTIDLLKKEGMIQEIAVRNHDGRRFDANTEPHHHLICNICDAIVDVEMNLDHSSLVTEQQKLGYDIREARIRFYGVCPNCKKNEKAVQ